MLTLWGLHEALADCQRLADSLDAAALHRHLDEWARRFCPVLGHFRNGVHWSFIQVEYATDVVFRKQATFQPTYEAIVRTAVHIIKAEHVATFLGRKLSKAYQGKLSNDFSILGHRVLVTALVIREYFVQPTLVRNAL